MSDTITPAATIILLRAPDELLAITRALTMGFAGGAIAFPGGKVDPTDDPQAPAYAGFAALPRDDANARIAAARETFEETGILLSTGPHIPEAARAEARRALAAH